MNIGRMNFRTIKIYMKSFTELRKNKSKSREGFTKIKLAILGDSATQFLSQAIQGLGFESDADFIIYESDFGQIDQEILNPNSGLYEFQADFILIFHSSNKMLQKFTDSTLEQRELFASKHLSNLKDLYNSIKEKSSAKVLYYNLTELSDGVFGNFSTKVEPSFPYQLRKINYQLMDLSRDLKDLFLIDLSAICSRMGLVNFFNARLYVQASMAISLDALPIVAKQSLDVIFALKGKIRKCVIFDLDNTLWGGVIGDDGIERIEIGNLGNGKAHSQLQKWGKQLKERGIILAVCSKNDEDNAKEPFLKHPEMVLKLEDFAIFVANWNNKADNIRDIQKVLNIGFDSMVFIDDNPYERNLVRENIPEVCVPELPEDPVDYVDFLRNENLFETTSYSGNDQKRTEQYQAEAERIVFQKSFSDPGEYLASLEMTAEVKEFDSFSIPRVAQLAERSNQFNLRTIRYSEAEIVSISNSDNQIGLTYGLKDKYGDYGIIAVLILNKTKNHFFIDTWIMSCRVLKRGVEWFILNDLVTRAKELGIAEIHGEYIPTKKNKLVKDHYQSLGFKSRGSNWVLNLGEYQNLDNYITKN